MRLFLQRMCDDVPSFTDGSVTLSIGAVRKLMNIIAFSGGAPLGLAYADQGSPPPSLVVTSLL